MVSRLSGREKVFLGVLAAVLALGGFFYFIAAPQYKAYARLKEQLNGELVKLGQAQARANSLAAETGKLARAREEMQAAGKRFAVDLSDGSEIILLGMRLALQDLQVKSVLPGAGRENRHTVELPVKLEVEGGFRDLVTFCRDLDGQMENLINPAEIRNIKIEAGDGGLSSGRVKAVINIVFFTARNPRETMKLEQVQEWRTGRDDVFQPAPGEAPVPGLNGRLHPPPGLDDDAPAGGAGRPAPVGEVTAAKPAAQSPGTKVR